MNAPLLTIDLSDQLLAANTAYVVLILLTGGYPVIRLRPWAATYRWLLLFGYLFLILTIHFTAWIW